MTANTADTETYFSRPMEGSIPHGDTQLALIRKTFLCGEHEFRGWLEAPRHSLLSKGRGLKKEKKGGGGVIEPPPPPLFIAREKWD